MARWRSLVKAVVPGSGFSTSRIPHVALELGVSLSLAFLVWLYTRSRSQETLDHVPIPVQIALAPACVGQYDLEVNGSSRVTVSFTGPPSRVRELRASIQRGAVQVGITLSIPEDRPGEATYRDNVRVEAEDVPVPPGVTAMLVEGRNQIPVTVRRLVERRLPVRLDYVGDERIGRVHVEPATVLVRGPKDILDHTRSLPTRPYLPPESAGKPAAAEAVVQGLAPLVGELEGRPVQVTPAAVAVSFRVLPPRTTYELADVPVHFLCPPHFPWRPRFLDEEAGKVTLRLVGPAQDEPPPVTAYLDLTRGIFKRGRNTEPVRLQLPKGFQPADDALPRLEFRLDPADVNAIDSTVWNFLFRVPDTIFNNPKEPEGGHDP
jgi:hypothetical protein